MKGAFKRQAQETSVSGKLDGCVGDIAKVRNFVCEFWKSQGTQSGREE